MKSIYLVAFLALLCISLNKADDLQIGNATGGTLAYLENVKLGSIPFTTRTKNVFFSSSKNQIIRAISAIDLNPIGSKAKATVTAGGVGSTFVNIKMKSERGEGLNYQVQIFS